MRAKPTKATAAVSTNRCNCRDTLAVLTGVTVEAGRALAGEVLEVERRSALAVVHARLVAARVRTASTNQRQRVGQVRVHFRYHRHSGAIGQVAFDEVGADALLRRRDLSANISSSKP